MSSTVSLVQFSASPRWTPSDTCPFVVSETSMLHVGQLHACVCMKLQFGMHSIVLLSSLLSGFSMCIPPYPFIPYPQPGGQAFMPLDTYPCPDLSTQWKQPVFNPFPEQVAMYDSVHCTPKPMGFGVAMPHITGSTAEPSRVPTITGPGLYEHRQTLPPPVSIL